MDSDQLLQSLGVTLGLPSLRFDRNGCARLAVDGAPALNFERDGDTGIHLYSVLCNIPSEGREWLYERLLKGNLFATARGALAIDEQHGEVVLCLTVPSDLSSAQSFAAVVETFIDTADTWQRRLEGAPAEGDVTSLPAASQPRMMEHFLRG